MMMKMISVRNKNIYCAFIRFKKWIFKEFGGVFSITYLKAWKI